MIDPELKTLLEKNIEKSEETLSVVKGLRSMQRWGSFFTILKWVLIIGVSLGAYYYIEPYLAKLLDAYTQFNDTISGVQKIGESVGSTASSTTSLLEKLRGTLEGLSF